MGSGEANGARAVFDGVSILRLRDGQIGEYCGAAPTPAILSLEEAAEARQPLET